MAVHQLSKSEWQSYCDRVSKGLEGKRAQIEVAALGVAPAATSTTVDELQEAESSNVEDSGTDMHGAPELRPHPE
ncbi:DUF5335 family protein [Pleomorphomonas koreensis]|uniref:DUF5335 family protein n=1 Tax=Pleomorphomonas koreensis TaxID=257440 RepID=UPI000A0005D9|nr:DUF5335 family protein [Pleomorphomonas koreensis]